MYQVIHHVTFESLPLELQEEIFFFCLSPFPRFSIKEAPIVLARVCRTWRSIVLSTPRLWSSFEVEIQGSGASGLLHDTRLMRRMKLWLERSSSSCCPLSIRLVYNLVGRVSDDRFSPLFDVLVPETHRWQHIHFTLPAASFVKLQPFPPNSFPMLRSLTLKVVGVRSPSDPPLNILAKNIPWHQLTSLDLQLESNNLPTLDEGLDILSKTVNLKRSTLQLECSMDRRNMIRWDKLPLPTIDSLQLILQGTRKHADPSEVCLAQFLNVLCFSKLRVLHLEWLVNDNMGSWSPVHTDFLAFLQRSAETLHQLTMTYFPISENELLECLLQVPRLTHLDLRFALNEGANDPVTDRLLMACTIPSPTISASAAPWTLLPRLEYVNLQCHGKLYTNVTLLALIQSRWNSSDDRTTRRPLRYFRVLSMKLVSSEVERHVKGWHEAGLEVDIQCLVVR